MSPLALESVPGITVAWLWGSKSNLYLFEFEPDPKEASISKYDLLNEEIISFSL